MHPRAAALPPEDGSIPEPIVMTMADALDPRRVLDAAPMSRVQVVAVLITVLDGYDVLSMSFVAPAVSHAWGIDHETLGLVLSCGLVGMAIGSLALAPLADFVGRQPVVLAAVALMAAGSFLSAFTHAASRAGLVPHPNRAGHWGAGGGDQSLSGGVCEQAAPGFCRFGDGGRLSHWAGVVGGLTARGFDARA